MQIMINTDRNVDVSDGLVARLDAELETALARFSDQLTRVEAHLGDENGEKEAGDDKRCLLEARPAGRPPVVVTHHASTVAEACTGAVEKLEHLLDSAYGKSQQRKGGESIRHLGVTEELL